jgi:hypothetical protein
VRQALLWLSHQQSIFKFVRSNRLANHFASRFVAGETLDSAVAAVKELNTKRIRASLDLLGESVTKPEEATAAKDEYLRMLDRIAADKVDANVSVKLTQMGQDISEGALRENAFAILARARQHNSFVRFDMEGTPYTGRTLTFEKAHAVAVQIDHVVALSDAWQTGAQTLSAADRLRFANDPVNLFAVDGPTNESKGDADAASWLPPNRAFRCTYVEHQIAAKARYGLWVTLAEAAAMRRVLGTCPGARIPDDGS